MVLLSLLNTKDTQKSLITKNYRRVIIIYFDDWLNSHKNKFSYLNRVLKKSLSFENSIANALRINLIYKDYNFRPALSHRWIPTVAGRSLRWEQYENTTSWIHHENQSVYLMNTEADRSCHPHTNISIQASTWRASCDRGSYQRLVRLLCSRS